MADIPGSPEISQDRKDTYESAGIPKDRKDLAVVWRMIEIPGSPGISQNR